MTIKHPTDGRTDWSGETDHHTHEFAPICEFTHAPCPPGPPAHTHFIVLYCRCGRIDPFPSANYQQTTAAFRADFEALVAQFGWRINLH